MNYIIVDDEHAAHINIENFANELPYVNKVANCYHAFEAIDVLKSKDVDLVFLDINMPKLSGFELLKSLRQPPKIIVTTAYQEYALEGYELDIVDYLLKPFSLNRFLKAVNKALDSITKPNKVIQAAPHAEPFIFVKSDKKHYKLWFNDILFVEAKGNYVKFQTLDKALLSYISLTQLEKSLPDDRFIRVHKSFLVSMEQISVLQGNRLIIHDFQIPIGQNYRKFVLSKLGLDL